jgi:hypothetical protein
MAEPYLSKDESIILATDNVIVRSVSLPALVLTNKRILLIQTDGEDISAEEIPLSKLRSAEVDKHAAPRPVLSLSYVTDTGEIQQETLTFLPKDGKQREEECGEWVKKLSEHIAPSFGEETLFRRPQSSQEPVMVSAAEPVSRAPTVRMTFAAGKENAAQPGTEGLSQKTSAPGEILAKHERLSGLIFPDVPPIAPEAEATAPAPRWKFVALAALVIVIIAVITGAFLFTQYLQPKPGQPPVPVTTAPAITRELTTVPTPVLTTPVAPVSMANVSVTLSPVPQETPPPTPTPTLSAPQIPVSQTGVWVRVQYAGKFTGSIGEGGAFRQVNGTGDQFYQLIAKKGIVHATIQKEDGSSGKLMADMYQNGALIEHRATTVPFGVVNIEIELKATTPAATVIPNVTATNVTIEKP